MNPFTPDLDDIKQVLKEVNKFYILIEKTPSEEPPPAFVVGMHQYAANLQIILEDRFNIMCSHADALALFKDCLEMTACENPNYTPLTHHELKPGEVFYIGKPKYIGKVPTEQTLVPCRKEKFIANYRPQDGLFERKEK